MNKIEISAISFAGTPAALAAHLDELDAARGDDPLAHGALEWLGGTGGTPNEARCDGDQEATIAAVQDDAGVVWVCDREYPRTSWHVAEMIPKLNRAEKIIQAAIREWVMCDWTHDHPDGGLCEGGDETCDYCTDADADAEAAQEHGREAIEALREWDLASAAEEVEAARSLEDGWGDAPAWTDVWANLLAALVTETEHDDDERAPALLDALEEAALPPYETAEIEKWTARARRWRARVTLALDAGSDLREAHCCDCGACVTAFAAAWEEAAKKAWAALGGDPDKLSVAHVAYGGAQEYDRCTSAEELEELGAAGLWQAAHDGVPTGRWDDCEGGTGSA